MPARLARLRARPWLRPRSLRGRITAVATAIATLLLVPAGMAGGATAHHVFRGIGLREVREQARITANDVRAGRVTGPVVPRIVGADLVQVVAPDHRVVYSSAAARGLAPLSTTWPAPHDPQQDVRTCAQAKVGCLWLSAVRVDPGVRSLVVYAARRVPGALSAEIVDAVFAAQVAVLICLTAGATWKVTGRTLKPVETIRAELAAINVNDLSSRVPEPSGEDEIARLARTINHTLGRLEHAKNRMDRALGHQRQFASDASHELRTPIAGLRTRLEEAQLYPDEIDLESMLERAIGDIDRLESIAADLLLLARLDTNVLGTLQTVDLAELVESQVVRRTDVHKVRLTLEPGVTVEGAPTHIDRALANLLDNAQRHAKHAVHAEVRRNAQWAELIVTDDGYGIPEADRERIFQRFTRLDAARSRDHGGAGLGLAIVREIAQAHCGTLHIEDPPNGGARFVLRLPLTRSADRRGDQDGRQAGEQSQEQARDWGREQAGDEGGGG